MFIEEHTKIIDGHQVSINVFDDYTECLVDRGWHLSYDSFYIPPAMPVDEIFELVTIWIALDFPDIEEGDYWTRESLEKFKNNAWHLAILC